MEGVCAQEREKTCDLFWISGRRSELFHTLDNSGCRFSGHAAPQYCIPWDPWGWTVIESMIRCTNTPESILRPPDQKGVAGTPEMVSPICGDDPDRSAGPTWRVYGHTSLPNVAAPINRFTELGTHRKLVHDRCNLQRVSWVDSLI